MGVAKGGHVTTLESRLRHVVPPRPHGYVTCSYAGYAKRGYATWLCHIWLRRLCQNLVTPHGYATYSHVGYALHDYSTWLRYPVRLVGLIGNSSIPQPW